jgi:hypothetical protein
MKHTLLLIVIGGCALAQTINLEARPGLWETTTVTQSAGMPAIDTSKMPPEAQKRMAEMMSKQRAPQTHTSRSCMTKEKLQKDMFMDDRQASCKRTILTNTRSSVEVKVECTNEKANMTGVFHLDAVNRENVKGSMKMQGPVNIDMTMTSKWISDDCGDKK